MRMSIKKALFLPYGQHGRPFLLEKRVMTLEGGDDE